MLVLHQFLCVLFILCGIFMHFPELTYWRDATVSVPVSCWFYVSEKLHRKYSRNWTKRKPKFLFTWHEYGVQRREGGGPEGSRTIGWRGPPPGYTTRWCAPLVHPLTLPPINSLWRESPKGMNTFPQNILQAAAVVVRRSGGSRSSSRHPAREGNHHRRPSSSPCQPPKWCVSSLPWTMGP
jgi:hypothetical protein